MRFNLFNKVTPESRILKKASTIADKVLSREDEFKVYSIEELRDKTAILINKLKTDKYTLDDVLIDALCIIREAFSQVHNMRAYRVQLIGAIIVYFGDFAEMMTGEGKTLTLVLASFVASLTEKGVHIVSVNEYLVERDAQFSASVLNLLGLQVGYIKAAMNANEKRNNYNCHITYCSNSELGFDYLRDNMVHRYEEKVQHGLNFAIVDEADSILIDEARTPLIISGSPSSNVSDYIKVDSFVKTLQNHDYITDEESYSVTLSDYGAEKAQEYFNIKNIYDLENSDLLHKILNALKAVFLFSNGKEYIVRKNTKGDDEIMLVDQFTGRIMEGRSYSAGLQQALQAKEFVPIQPENFTVATITYQSLFRLYTRLSGVSGTAATESEELLNIYNMVVVRIPTNKPIQRIDESDYIFGDKKTKWKFIVAEIIKRHKTGQPILIGTAAVEESEVLHLLLQRVGIPHQLLNAKNHASEAEIIKHAGEKNQVTIATYMAGRGTDIKINDDVRALGGLYVIGTERNESRRIDNQLRGRAGRQGDPGESRFFISMQDSLFKRFAGDRYQKANQKIDDAYIDLKFFSSLLNTTQKRVEGLNFDTRKNLIDYDSVLSSQRELIYKQRDKILLSKNLLPLIQTMSKSLVTEIVENNHNEINTDTFNLGPLTNEINNLFFKKVVIEEKDLITLNKEDMINFIFEKIKKLISDEVEIVSVEYFNQFARQIILDNIDNAWTRHLDVVGKVRESVNLRAYEQKSPLNIYIDEVDKLFAELKHTVASKSITEIINLLFQFKNVVDSTSDNNDEIQKLDDPKIRETFANQIFTNDDKHEIWQLLSNDKIKSNEWKNIEDVFDSELLISNK